MADATHAKVEFHRAMLRVLTRVRDLETAFESWADAARALDAVGAEADDDAQHAVIDEVRAAFVRIVERFPAAVQLIGIDRFVALAIARQESLS